LRLQAFSFGGEGALPSIPSLLLCNCLWYWGGQVRSRNSAAVPNYPGRNDMVWPNYRWAWENYVLACALYRRRAGMPLERSRGLLMQKLCFNRYQTGEIYRAGQSSHVDKLLQSVQRNRKIQKVKRNRRSLL